MSQQTNCLRCQRPCRTGTPDNSARAIRQTTGMGFCPDCMVQKTLQTLPTAALIARHGPQCLLMPHMQECIAGLLRLTQLNPAEINWQRVVDNWALPFPAGRGPNTDNASLL